jgi:hypothetical protein
LPRDGVLLDSTLGQRRRFGGANAALAALLSLRDRRLMQHAPCGMAAR